MCADGGMAIQAGDLIQLECDPSYWLENVQRFKRAEIGLPIRLEPGESVGSRANRSESGHAGATADSEREHLRLRQDAGGPGTPSSSPEISESRRKAKEEFGKELGAIDLYGGRLSSALGRSAEGGEPRQGGQVAELIAVKIQLWRPE